MSGSDFREEVKKIEKEAPFTIWKFFKWAVVVIIVIAVLGFLAQSLGIFSMDIKREVTQHSQQYVETKINLLNKLHTDWLQLDTEIAELRTGEDNEEIITAKQGQQKNTINRIHTEAEMIPSSQVPPTVRSFIRNHPR